MAISNQVTIHPNDIDDGWISIYYPSINNMCEPLGISVLAVFNWVVRLRIHIVSVRDGKIIGHVERNRFYFMEADQAQHTPARGLMYG